MADAIYRNALRAARELWFDEQNLGELIQDPESFVCEAPRARMRPEPPAAGEGE